MPTLKPCNFSSKGTKNDMLMCLISIDTNFASRVSWRKFSLLDEN